MTQYFIDTTIILPVMNETFSLVETIETIEASTGNEVLEYLIVYCEKTSPEAITTAEILAKRFPEKTFLLKQTRPFLGGAIQDAFLTARGSHVVMMASDLETSPDNVRNLISSAKAHPNAITTASRWTKSGGIGAFHGYDKVKLVSNFVFQKIFSWLYGTSLTDLTFGFRIFPTQLVREIHWEEFRHPFLLETIVKPLRLGIQVFEIPTTWHRRQEGDSSNSFLMNFVYFRVGIKVRFYKRSRILKGFSAPHSTKKSA